MKILIIASFPESLMLFRGELIRRMVAFGHEVHVACPDLSRDPRVTDFLAVENVQVHEIPLRRTGLNVWHDLICVGSLVRLIHKINPTHVFAYTIKPVIYGMLTAGLCRVKTRAALVTGLGYAFTHNPGGLRFLLKRLLMSMYKVSLGFSTQVFFQNVDDCNLFKSLNLVNGQKCKVVNGSGINLNAFPETGFNDFSKGINFLLIARLLKDKGINEYAEAARSLVKSHQNCKFHLVGWFDSNPAAIAESKVKRWVADGIIQFHGRLEDVRPILEMTHVYVLPSYREGTPRTVLEAMAMGRPIITTDAPGCRETVIDGENGFLVPVMAVDELAFAMERFIINPALIAKMGKRSRAIAEAKYDVDKVNASILDTLGIYDEAAV